MDQVVKILIVLEIAYIRDSEYFLLYMFMNRKNFKNKMYLANMLNSKILDLTISQVQNSMDLANISDPKNLGLAVNQFQSSVGLAHMLNP